MKILVDSFDAKALTESFCDYGIEGQVDYLPGELKGKLYAENGTYEFLCLFDTSEVELSNLIIGIGGVSEV